MWAKVITLQFYTPWHKSDYIYWNKMTECLIILKLVLGIYSIEHVLKPLLWSKV